MLRPLAARVPVLRELEPVLRDDVVRGDVRFAEPLRDEELPLVLREEVLRDDEALDDLLPEEPPEDERDDDERDEDERDEPEDDFVSPFAARVLLTVRAAISFARFSDRPSFSSDSFTCSYCRSRFALHDWGIGAPPPRLVSRQATLSEWTTCAIERLLRVSLPENAARYARRATRASRRSAASSARRRRPPARPSP
jgi:hypothetical protein